ncbi:MAG: hypothetical protein K1Y36_09680 [Blastocatellia bacterium]|nr:hypothetical protein [Blastocatellia bacterium]
MALWICALWYHFYRNQIRQSLQIGTFWKTSCYPSWAGFLGVYYVGLFYSFSGCMKLTHSGLAWANGVSLQLWVSIWGNPDSTWTHLILSYRWFAKALQAATLCFESMAILGLLFPRLRPFLGLALLGFHFGQVTVFGWQFHYNAFIICLYFLPFDRYLPILIEYLKRRSLSARRVIEISPTLAGRLKKGCYSRLDILELYEYRELAQVEPVQR